MKARLTISNIMKFRLLAVVLFVSCLAFVFTPNTYAVDKTYFKDNIVMIDYSYILPYPANNYTQVSHSTATLLTPSVYDAETGIGQYAFSMTQPSGCNNQCKLVINFIEVTPRSLVNGQPVYPSGDGYNHIRVYSAHDFFIGYLSEAYGPAFNNIYMSTRGGDAWIGNSVSNHSSCQDQPDTDCQVLFWQNNTDYDPVFAYHGFTINHKTPATAKPYHTAIWQYNLDSHSFIWNYTGGPSWFIPFTNPIVFYVEVYTDDKLSNSDDDDSINLDNVTPDFDVENKIINRNTNTAENSIAGLNIDFSVPWVFQAWFNLFVDSTCVNIPNLQGMLHSSESVVCTPWSSSLRSTLTPIFSVLSSMLAFAFVIRWLSKSSSKEAEIYG